MTLRTVESHEKESFDRIASHPLQSWAWGEFRKSTGIDVLRLGRFEGTTLKEVAQITFHPLPHLPYTIGYFPKGNLPTPGMLEKIISEGKKRNCIFIKFEPNLKKEQQKEFVEAISSFQLVKSAYPLFTKYTFILPLSPTEEELLKGMHPKTRYNIRIAQKHDVKVEEGDSKEQFEEYLRLTFETTKRQNFFAHNRDYHRKMWEKLKQSGVSHLFTATYQGKVLVAWIVFLFNNTLYYPYGASSSESRQVMASNLMMWEVIKWGKKNGAREFDMWGALSSDPDPTDSWFGFHRFKQGYGAIHTEYVGSFDLVIQPLFYQMYKLLYQIRSLFLFVKSRI